METARALLLFRHAKSAWPDVADHDRPLAPRGQRDAPVMGRWLAEAGLVPDQVVCSTARRARDTWQLAEAALGASPRVSFEPGLYGAPAAGLLAVARQTPPAVMTLLLVGHNPAIQELAVLLAAPGPAQGQLEQVRGKFPTAAIAVLRLAVPWPELAPGGAQLTDFATPRSRPGRRAGR